MCVCVCVCVGGRFDQIGARQIGSKVGGRDRPKVVFLIFNSG